LAFDEEMLFESDSNAEGGDTDCRLSK